MEQRLEEADLCPGLCSAQPELPLGSAQHRVPLRERADWQCTVAGRTDLGLVEADLHFSVAVFYLWSRGTGPCSLTLRFPICKLTANRTCCTDDDETSLYLQTHVLLQQEAIKHGRDEAAEKGDLGSNPASFTFMLSDLG